jgi:hypothetical protein
MKKSQVLRRVRPKYNKYKIDKMANEVGQTDLSLPQYHCDVNPTELTWAQVIL